MTQQSDLKRLLDQALKRCSPTEVAGIMRQLEQIELAELRLRLTSSLYEFMRYFWPVLEPDNPFVPGWPIEAICLHLEAVSDGRIKRLLINVSPGSSKSISCNVFFPAWEWAKGGSYASLRYLTFSYSSDLTRRDNGGETGRFSRLINSAEYRRLFGSRFAVIKDNESKVTNDKTGWKIASSVEGLGTGERGNRIIFDDPHKIGEAESKDVRTKTVEFAANTMSNRLNSLDDDAIIIIMQRVHEEDVSGFILNRENDIGYVYLFIPAISDGRCCETEIGWSDPRGEEEGLNYWPARFSDHALARMKATMLDFAWAGQYQQNPEVRGGGLFKREWWVPWDPVEADRWGCKYPAYPKFDLVIGAVDGAYTEDTENDPCAMTVWGVLNVPGRQTLVLLLAAWQKHLAFHDFELRIAETASRWSLDKLLIEAKANGIPIVQELRRDYGNAPWQVSKPPQMASREDWERPEGEITWKATGWSLEGVNVPGRKRGAVSNDKVSRATSVAGIMFDGIVYAPKIPTCAACETTKKLEPETTRYAECLKCGDNRAPHWEWTTWANMVINQAAIFPRGTHDDLVDTKVIVMRWLREAGLIKHGREATYQYRLDQTHGPRDLPPIYPT